MDRSHYTVLAQVSLSYSVPKGRFPRVTHPCATRPEGLVRLACVRHAASVRSEPGSNSQVDVTKSQHGKSSLGITNRQPQFRTPGADTCTCQTYGYEGHVMASAYLTGIRNPKIPGPGAVAHMSLHLNQQCQRADALPLPVFSRETGDRLREAQRG